jgi:DNA-directed RNA polymerase subunit M/transcription elongation factor TFIIS
MLPARRGDALRLLRAARPADFALCRDVEAACHAAARTAGEYGDAVRRAAFNLHANPAVGAEVVHAPDEALTHGTLVGRIRAEAAARAARFERMLADKYEEINDARYEALVRCRRCGSAEVTWDEKQTRSADEGATVFCACATCKHRWTMR